MTIYNGTTFWTQVDLIKLLKRKLGIFLRQYSKQARLYSKQVRAFKKMTQNF